MFGVDYYDMWAPVAKLRLIWLLLAVAMQNSWPIDMFNFHSAFLNGKLNSDKEVFMEQPQGYEESDKKRYVCKLFKSLYDLPIPKWTPTIPTQDQKITHPDPRKNGRRTMGDGHPNSGTKVHHLPHTQILTPGTEMRAGPQDLFRPH